jgi:hypothetical protein
MNRLLSGAGLLALAAATVTVGVAAAGNQVPLKARDSGSFAVVAAAGTVIQTSDTASGEGTQLGRYTMVAGERIDLVSGEITQGYFTITAANGDTLTGTYSGKALGGLTGYDVSGPITGGTGRFAGATGTIVFNGTVDPTAPTFSDVVTGTISTVGSR